MQIQKVESNAALEMRRSTDVAGVCRDIVSKTALAIQGRKYVRVEGWQSIAAAHGCLLSAGEVEKVEGGIRATANLVRGTDGVSLARAEGFVGDDEATWAGRPEYARRAMAQTRAMSRCARTAFAHVVVLMDAGLSTTPAEEVPAGGFEDPAPAKRATAAPRRPAAAAPAGQAAPAAQAAPAPAGQAAPAANGAPDWRKVEVHFGKNKGTPLGALRPESLDWYQRNWEPKPNPNDGSMDPRDRVLRDALDLSMQENERMAGMVGNLARDLKDEGTDDILV